MQELKKIFEEIDAHSIEFELFGISDDYLVEVENNDV